ncbi:hypothetical protein JB92DRAFT_3125328 [Gautieria morchelliformis]|nr:hypothetical protein JB92DRAFT_3125328 [Gautieria morchelliformis]
MQLLRVWGDVPHRPHVGSDTLNEEDGEEGGQMLYMPQDYEYTPYGEWPSSATSVLGRPKCSLPPSPEDHQHVVEIDTPHHVPQSQSQQTCAQRRLRAKRRGTCPRSPSQPPASPTTADTTPACTAGPYRPPLFPSSLARKARNHTRLCAIQRTPINALTPGID